MTESTEKRPPGHVKFAAVTMAGIGLFATLSAIAGFTGSTWLKDGSFLGDALDLVWYGAIDGLIAIASIYAAYGIWKGQKAAYWTGFIVSVANATRWLVMIPIAPVWAVTMVALMCLVAYGLTSNEEYYS
jgi:hypothetical protein